MTDLAVLERDLEEAARTLPVDAVPDLLAVLEAIKARLWARLLQPAPSRPTSSPNQTAEQIAARYDLEVSWVRQAARKRVIPAIWCGKYLRFDADAVQAALEQLPPPRRKARVKPVRRRTHRMAETAHETKPRKNGTLQATATILLPREETV
jgi:hypothetical protein